MFSRYWLGIALVVLGSFTASYVQADLQVGAAIVDVTPLQLPVLVNGGMTSRSVDQISTRVNARAIVLMMDASGLGWSSSIAA